MTSYTVVAPGWTGSPLPGSTPVVLMTQSLLQTLPAGWTHATGDGGGAFAFFNDHDAALGAQTLTMAALDDAAIGSEVLISTGSRWVIGAVMDDAASAVAGLPPSTRAAFPVVGYVAPPASPTRSGFEIIATAHNGEIWFRAKGPYSSIEFYASAMSTLGAVPPGTAAMVEIAPSTFQRVQL